ncbi:MAG TPA: cell wall-binding repeat-containing protein, partial [Acidothermaceae bacterium]
MRSEGRLLPGLRRQLTRISTAAAVLLAAPVALMGASAPAAQATAPNDVYYVTAPAMASVGDGIYVSLQVGMSPIGGPPDTFYTGTVHISTTDSAAFTPADTWVPARDQGKVDIGPIVFKTAGSQTITVTDDSYPALNGSAVVDVVQPGPATGFEIATAANDAFTNDVATNAISDIAIVPVDGDGNVVPTYRGTVHLSSTDPTAQLPVDYTFTASDDQPFVGEARFGSAGTQTITATDTTNSAITGTTDVAVIDPGPAAYMTASMSVQPAVGGTSVGSNGTGRMLVTVWDADGTQDTNYRGTLHFLSIGSGVTVPADYTFTAQDAGAAAFAIGFTGSTQLGVQVTDTVTGMTTGASAWVAPSTGNGAATQLILAPGGRASVGVPTYQYVEADSTYGGLDPTYQDVLNVTTTDPASVHPATYPAEDGSAIVPITFKTAGRQVVTLTDPATGWTVSTAYTVVAPGPTTGFAVSLDDERLLTGDDIDPNLASVVPGVSSDLYIEPVDANGDPTPSYTGAVHVSSSDPAATLPPDATVSDNPGDGGTDIGSVVAATTGTQRVTVTDVSNPSIHGSTPMTVLQAGPAALLAASVADSGENYGTVSLGSAAAVTVVATDAEGFPVPSYQGTVTVSTSDSHAQLPPSVVISGQHGGGTIAQPLVFGTDGVQSLTVTDGTLHGATSANVLTAGPATHLRLDGPSQVLSGSGFSISVEALDAHNDLAPTYTGTVHFTSTAAAATMPANTAFASVARGHLNVAGAKLTSLGFQTITATDTAHASMSGSLVTDVVTAPTGGGGGTGGGGTGGGGTGGGGTGGGGAGGGGAGGGGILAGGPVADRLAGSDRYATAVATSQAEFPDRGASAVVLARGDDYPDALVGAPLAAAKNAPLLLSSGASLPPVTKAELLRVLATGGTVYVLGGVSAVPASVESELTSLGYHVVRLSGTDRFATAVAVANELGNPSTVLLASGINYPDALAAGPAASHSGGVVLLTNGNAMPT